MTLARRYTFKLRPSRTQERALREQARMMAELWNALLEMNETRYRHERRRLTFYDMTACITELRHECPEWAELSVWSAHRVANALDQAFKHFMRRARQGAGRQSGYPRYRRVAIAEWLPHRFVSGCKLTPTACERSDGVPDPVTARNWRLRLKGVPGLIRARGQLPALPTKWTDADVRHHSGAWWLSVAVEMEPRRVPGEHATEVRFDLINEFAQVAMGPRRSRLDDEPKAVNGRMAGIPVPGPGNGGPPSICGHGGQRSASSGSNGEAKSVSEPNWSDIYVLQERIDAMKAERDLRWPRKRGQRPSRRWREATRRIGRLSTKLARKRREMLHEWTTAVTRSACSVLVVKPESLKETTKSGRGNEKSWGAAVETKAAFNRHVLSQAPASAVQMLAYKSAEAGIEYHEAEHDDLRVGNLAVRNRKILRQTRRTIRQEQAVT